MDKENWSFKPADLITIPNILTYVRFLLIAPFTYFFLTGNFIFAAVCIGISGLSDCFDGMLARKLNQVTPLGKVLDPIADKLTLFAVVISLAIRIKSVLPLFVMLLLKDALMLLGGMDLVKKGITPPAAKWYGKLGTVVFYCSVSIMIFLRAALNYENHYLDFSLILITALTMFFALSQYARVYFALIKEYNEKNGE
ncbi:MAG: CDP-alcohol phosphatidyltransferase family protein [Ruminococcus sp.]|nr:CDP-alcohol phosphatidyltransferase family protein [Ruminococcus sp.]